MESLREVEFRDGARWIPAYLADMMSGLKTHTLTYEQAVEKANWNLARGHIDKAAEDVIRSHFRDGSS